MWKNKGNEINNCILQVNISDEVLAERRKNFIPKKKKLNSKWLAQYRTLVTNASKGAVLEAEF